MGNEALIERLLNRERYIAEGPAYLMRTCEEAAAALKAAEADNKRLIEALEALISGYENDVGETTGLWNKARAALAGGQHGQ